MKIFKIDFVVRDTEVDMQGIVNNCNYAIYLQHARHEYLKSIGVSFVEMTKQKQNLVLTSTQIEFKNSLLPNDKFYVTCKMQLISKIRIGIYQEIRLLSDELLIAVANNTAVCLDGNKENKPYLPPEFKKIFI